jgi:chemotaxis protein histidine kinase CheA
VQELNGAIQVTSTPGRGTRFNVRLPLITETKP